MTKTKTPFFSFASHGTVANAITSQKRGSATLIRRKPTPTDPQSLAQIYQRWDYQDYIAWWHTLSQSAKLIWETNARPFHMTGFAYWMKHRLTNLPDLAGRWHLDERTASIAYDSSRNNNNGTIYGAQHSSGYIDYALDFDGIDDLVAIPDSPLWAFGTADFTLELWANLSTLAQDSWWRAAFLGHSDGDGLVNKWYFSYDPGTKKLLFHINSPAGENIILRSDILSLVTNTWYYFALVKSADIWIFYKNGVPIGSLTQAATLHDADAPLIIGWGEGTGGFEGIIDEVKVCSRALATSDIKRHSLRKYPL